MVGGSASLVLDDTDTDLVLWGNTPARYYYQREKEKSYESDLSENSCWDILLFQVFFLVHHYTLIIYRGKGVHLPAL